MADTNNYDSFQKVEKWTTREKFNALDLSTIETGTEYNLTGKIGANDLDSELLVGINGKLTAPPKPLENSVVTMLADGTVGTKPLIEIGGGKIYRHHIILDVTYDNAGYQKIDGMIFIDIYSSSSTAITLDTIPQLANGDAYIAHLYNPGYGKQGVVGVIFRPTYNEIEVYGAGSSIMEQFESLYYLFPYNAVTRFVDDYTEI